MFSVQNFTVQITNYTEKIEYVYTTVLPNKASVVIYISTYLVDSLVPFAGENISVNIYFLSLFLHKTYFCLNQQF